MIRKHYLLRIRRTGTIITKPNIQYFDTTLKNEIISINNTENIYTLLVLAIQAIRKNSYACLGWIRLGVAGIVSQKSCQWILKWYGHLGGCHRIELRSQARIQSCELEHNRQLMMIEGETRGVLPWFLDVFKPLITIDNNVLSCECPHNTHLYTEESIGLMLLMGFHMFRIRYFG